MILCWIFTHLITHIAALGTSSYFRDAESAGRSRHISLARASSREKSQSCGGSLNFTGGERYLAEGSKARGCAKRMRLWALPTALAFSPSTSEGLPQPGFGENHVADGVRIAAASSAGSGYCRIGFFPRTPSAPQQPLLLSLILYAEVPAGFA